MSRPAPLEAAPQAPRAFRIPGLVFWLLPVAACLWMFWPFLMEGRVVWGTDLQALGWPFNFSARRALSLGEWPLWNPDIFGGMPGIGSSNLNLLYPFWLAYTLLDLPVLNLQGYDACLHLCLAAWGMWLLLRALGSSRWAAAVSGFAYAFSGTLVSILYAGHTNNVEAYALIPWIFWAACLGTSGGTAVKTWGGWALAGMFLGMQITATGTQAFAYTILGLAAFAFWRTWARPATSGQAAGSGFLMRGSRYLALLAGLALAAGLTLLISAPQLFTSLQYLPYSWRKDFSWQTFTAWSFPWKESLQWWVPGWFGWKEPGYCGEWPFCLSSEYFGLLPWALAAAALAAGLKRRKGPERFFLGLGLASFLIACGALHHLFFHLPVYSGFRSWTRFLCLFTFSISVLAGLGFDWLRDLDLRARQRALQACLAFLGAMALLGLVLYAAAPWHAESVRSLLESKNGNEFPKAAASMRASAVLCIVFSLLFAALIGGLAWLGKRAPQTLVLLPAALLLLHLADLTQMKDRYLVFTEPGRVIAKPARFSRLPDPGALEPFRIQEIGAAQETNEGVLYGYESVEGYHGLMIGEHRLLRDAMNARPLDYLNLMNARYLFSLAAYKIPGWEEIGQADGMHVYENRLALGQAFLVSRTRSVASEDQAQALLKDARFDLGKQALLLDGPVLTQGVSKGRVEWKKRSTQGFELEVENFEKTCLVISQNWYPGWQAWVDGTPARIYCADLALQALVLEPGRHKVVFKFTSPWFFLGLALAGLGWLGIAVFGFYCLRRSRKNSAGSIPPAVLKEAL